MATKFTLKLGRYWPWKTVSSHLKLLLWMNINKIIKREVIFEKLFQNPNVSQMKFTLEFQRIKCVRKGWFPVSRNFHLRTCVKFTLVDKIEVSPFYLASILFPWSKFTCVNVRNQKRVSGNQLKFLNQCDELHNKAVSILSVFPKKFICLNLTTAWLKSQ